MDFYSYLWLRENGTAFYVGKGKGDRAFVSDGHRAPAPKDSARIIVQEYPTEEEAFEAEIFFIEYYGRKDLGTGSLINLTSGGDGVRGAINWWVGRKHRSESREKQRLAKLGKKQDPEIVEKRIAPLRGRKIGPYSLERRQKNSEIMKQLWSDGRFANKKWTPEGIASVKAANARRPKHNHSLETRQKIREASLHQWAERRLSKKSAMANI